ncbi:hypothetical protein PILCRDRAFT_824939 [Piloderma croceum F 1598]|uniref:Thioredoxin domain-containing protein n=1 Tax=Piloderma croceum (strain F 1598) TaxID=765440 RepID=A0A0C3EZG7_PILCF|nr:hypothetical protein PILCRDRAFT_824939 [Piloderma croceum F 1598]
MSSCESGVCVSELKSMTQFNDIVSGAKLVIIMFRAPWCGICVTTTPLFDDIARLADRSKVTFYYVDTEKHGPMEVALQLNIREIPTFKAYKNKCCVGEVVGINTAGLKNLVDDNV